MRNLITIISNRKKLNRIRSEAMIFRIDKNKNLKVLEEMMKILFSPNKEAFKNQRKNYLVGLLWFSWGEGVIYWKKLSASYNIESSFLLLSLLLLEQFIRLWEKIVPQEKSCWNNIILYLDLFSFKIVVLTLVNKNQ